MLLCFDEVITGFRMGLSSAQGALGVTPDLTILGKALAGGLPLSALAGKRNVMSVLRDGIVLGGGTFNSFPFAMAGAKYSIERMAKYEDELFSKRNDLQNKLMNGIKDIGKKHGFEILTQGAPGIFYLDFCSSDVVYDSAQLLNNDIELKVRLADRMKEQGILIAGASRML